jgi:hypothetical protein
MKKIKVALDVDGTIDLHDGFFAALSRVPVFEVHIVTGRGPEDRELTLKELAAWGVAHAGLHFADRWEDKARLCKELGISIFFEDQDEYIRWVPEGILVFKGRSGGNFDFDAGCWVV